MSMFKKLMVAVALVAIAIPAFSAVESIKVGGDMDVYGIKRVNMLDDDSMDFFQTHARVFVQAMLTDNVEVMVRLINERVWGMTDFDFDGSEYETHILLDLAYIKMSDILTPGLVLTVGKQEIQFGEGLVVGSAYLPYNYIYPSGDTWIMAEDLGKQKAFDAVRVDYSLGQAPVDITAFMAKIGESFDNDDFNLYGVNLGFNAGDVARVEAYYVRNQFMGSTNMFDNISTAGVRVSGDAAGFALKGEYARQFGKWMSTDNEGWALLLGGQYNFSQSDMGAYIKAQYNAYSASDSDANGWMSYYASNVASRIGAINYVLATTMNPYGLSNARVINIGGGIRPVEKIGLCLDWFNVNFADEPFFNPDESAVGNEIDAALTYNYNEDLTFGLQYGVLMTGDAVSDYFDDDPWQLIASMKIVF